MARHGWAALLVAAAAAGCGDDDQAALSGHFVAIRINVEHQAGDRAEVYVRMWGVEEERCPSLAEPIEIRANGVTGGVYFPGGPTSDDPMFATCREAELDVRDVPLVDHLELELDTPGLAFAVEWDGEHRLWTDDDIAAAMEMREPFTVSWIPQDAPPPALLLYDAGVGRQIDDPVVVLDDSGPGSASYHFEGASPPESWRLHGSSEVLGVVLQPCPLDESCVLDSWASLFEP